MDIKRLADAVEFNPEKLAKNALFESDHLFYDLYCLEVGQAQRVHAHAGSDKVYHVLTGRGVVTVGAEERTLGPGELAIARAGEPHGLRNDGPERLTALVVMAPRP